MVAKYGKTRLGAAAIAWFVLPQLPATLAAGDAARDAMLRMLHEPVHAQGTDPQQGPRDEELDRLRAMLALAGPDGRESREGAIERLLALPQPEAHRVLHERLRLADDPDSVRAAIVASLQRHWLLPAASQFGGASGPQRESLLADYVRVFAPLWRPLRDGTAVADEPLLAAVTIALQRLPARDLDAAARVVLAGAAVQDRLDVLRCLADMQQTLFAPTIAEYLDSPDQALRRGTRECLQLLVYADPPLRTREQFAAWFAANGTARYVDLVQRAARAELSPLDRVQQQLVQVRIDAAREVVKAHVSRSSGVDWPAIQARIVDEEPQVLEPCLDLLLSALPTLPEDTAPARFVFCRALLRRHHSEPVQAAARRSRLLEVAAWLGRQEEVELAGEIVGLLIAQLEAGEPQQVLSALRGLRRYPSVETRTRLVAIARRLLEQQPVPGERVAALLATLTSRASPRWTAPLSTDPDKADWLALVTACCRSEEPALREPALALAQMLTARDQRVPEVFDVLLALVRDERLPVKFRATCALHMQGWRNDGDVGAWVRAHHELLADPARELRQLAAEALTGLTDSVHKERSEWLASTILAVRNRLASEPEPAVVRALVLCLQRIGREPAMPEKAIGALSWVLTEMKYPVAPEHEFRLEPVLAAVATIGADQRADLGQWLKACAVLLRHERRQAVRLVLQTHSAADLAKDVIGADGALAVRAKQAMQYIIAAALMKPAAEAWSASEDLQREAQDVRRAFLALDGLDEKERSDEIKHRLLRLEVELVAGKPQDVVQRAMLWLANGSGNGSGNGASGSSGTGAVRTAAEESDRNRMRVLAASAQLALGRPDAARKLLDERTDTGAGAGVDAASLDLESRVARALMATDVAGAADMFERVAARTVPDDPQFRVRLVEWLSTRLRADPQSRAEVTREAERHRARFLQADCPPELHDAWKALLPQ